MRLLRAMRPSAIRREVIIGIVVSIGLAAVGIALEAERPTEAILIVIGVIITLLLYMINLLKDVLEERKNQIEWLEGKEKILNRAAEMRQASNSWIKAIWCLHYADNRKVLNYMNLDANLSIPIERLINIDAIDSAPQNRELVDKHIQALSSKMRDGTYRLYAAPVTGFELYIVDGKEALILIPKSVGGDLAIGLYSQDINIVNSFHNIFEYFIQIGKPLQPYPTESA